MAIDGGGTNMTLGRQVNPDIKENGEYLAIVYQRGNGLYLELVEIESRWLAKLAREIVRVDMTQKEWEGKAARDLASLIMKARTFYLDEPGQRNSYGVLNILNAGNDGKTRWIVKGGLGAFEGEPGEQEITGMFPQKFRELCDNSRKFASDDYYPPRIPHVSSTRNEFDKDFGIDEF